MKKLNENAGVIALIVLIVVLYVAMKATTISADVKLTDSNRLLKYPDENKPKTT